MRSTQRHDPDAMERDRWQRGDTLDPVARLAAQGAMRLALRDLAEREQMAALRARIRAEKWPSRRKLLVKRWHRLYMRRYQRDPDVRADQRDWQRSERGREIKREWARKRRAA